MVRVRNHLRNIYPHSLNVYAPFTTFELLLRRWWDEKGTNEIIAATKVYLTGRMGGSVVMLSMATTEGIVTTGVKGIAQALGGGIRENSLLFIG